ncbi:MAG TPA: hypothetical protein VMW43_04245, partial [Bacteroidota bacterium]|nr:hypothetical protein [Bacteroidota bacterium]
IFLQPEGDESQGPVEIIFFRKEDAPPPVKRQLSRPRSDGQLSSICRNSGPLFPFLEHALPVSHGTRGNEPYDVGQLCHKRGRREGKLSIRRIFPLERLWYWDCIMSASTDGCLSGRELTGWNHRPMNI